MTTCDIFSGRGGSFDIGWYDFIEGIGTVLVSNKNEEHVVLLVRSNAKHEMRFLSKSGNPPYSEISYTFSVWEDAPFLMSCAYESIVYSFYEHGGDGTDYVSIKCLDVSKLPPKTVNTFSTSLTDLGAMCLKKSWNCFLVAVTIPWSLDKSKYSDALRAFRKDGSTAWTFSYDDLDPEAEIYALGHMAVDRDFFYVLNNAFGTVYLVCSSGQKIHKVLWALGATMFIAFNGPSRRLCVFDNYGTLDVYRIVKK